MKITKDVPLFPACILSSIANILFIVKIAPEWAYKLGFVIVMISSIVMNIRTIINNKKVNKASNVTLTSKIEIQSKSLFFYLIIFALVFWIISYAIAVIKG
jgi:hypothetical protein